MAPSDGEFRMLREEVQQVRRDLDEIKELLAKQAGAWQAGKAVAGFLGISTLAGWASFAALLWHAIRPG